MAAQNKTPGPEAPLGGLRSETIAHLESIKKELDEASDDLDSLEEIGMDVSRLRERINWGYKAREIITKRLAKR